MILAAKKNFRRRNCSTWARTFHGHRAQLIGYRTTIQPSCCAALPPIFPVCQWQMEAMRAELPGVMATIMPLLLQKLNALRRLPPQ